MGQIARYKGVEVLIEAFNRLKTDYGDATLHFLGRPHIDFEADFHNQIADLVDGNRIKYWGYREDNHDFLKNAYVLVQPSLPSMVSESFGRTVVEAMAAAVPTICFRSGALPEHVVDGETGLICEEESVECLEHKLRQLLSSQALRMRFGYNGYQRYVKHYSVSAVRENWLRYFHEITDPRTTTRVSSQLTRRK